MQQPVGIDFMNGYDLKEEQGGGGGGAGRRGCREKEEDGQGGGGGSREQSRSNDSSNSSCLVSVASSGRRSSDQFDRSRGKPDQEPDAGDLISGDGTLGRKMERDTKTVGLVELASLRQTPHAAEPAWPTVTPRMELFGNWL